MQYIIKANQFITYIFGNKSEPCEVSVSCGQGQMFPSRERPCGKCKLLEQNVKVFAVKIMSVREKAVRAYPKISIFRSSGVYSV